MTITDFKAILAAHPGKKMRFILPGGKSIPAHYHITEVGHVKKDFIDCGGTVRVASACVLQAWVAVNDEDHRLEAGKLAAILKMADQILPKDEIPVELEYEAPMISQFAISNAEVAGDVIVFSLENKRTDCLAKESCGLDGGSCGPDDESCCGPDEPSEIRAENKSSCC